MATTEQKKPQAKPRAKKPAVRPSPRTTGQPTVSISGLALWSLRSSQIPRGYKLTTSATKTVAIRHGLLNGFARRSIWHLKHNVWDQLQTEVAQSLLLQRA